MISVMLIVSESNLQNEGKSIMLKTFIRMYTLLIILSVLLFSTTNAQSNNRDITIIHSGTALTIPGNEPLQNVSILIENGQILNIEEGFLEEKDINIDNALISIIDKRDSFVMPGFIDLHVHLMVGPNRDKSLNITKPDSYLTFIAQQNAYKTLMAGFTTIRDLGSKGTIVFGLRDAIKDNIADGPKIIVAGSAITPTGGHGDAHGYREEFLALMDDGNTCDGADGCRRAVRAMVKRGADVIKVTATGGVLSNTGTGTGVQFTQAELNAIAETAHALGRKVTAHAHEKEGIEAALKAGFDSIEHSMWADENTMKLFIETGAWLIPTIYPITYVGDTKEKVMQGPFKDLPPLVMEKLLRLGKQPKEMSKLAYDMGVNIAFGTDSGVSPNGENANEFLEYTAIGMTPMEALMAGTVNAAEAGGIDNIGKILPGMAADIVSMKQSPLDDISAVLDLNFIMRDGIIYKNIK